MRTTLARVPLKVWHVARSEGRPRSDAAAEDQDGLHRRTAQLNRARIGVVGAKISELEDGLRPLGLRKSTLAPQCLAPHARKTASSIHLGVTVPAREGRTRAAVPLAAATVVMASTRSSPKAFTMGPRKTRGVLRSGFDQLGASSYISGCRARLDEVRPNPHA